MAENSLEGNIGRDYTVSDEQLRAWKKKWKRFHKSLPDKLIFRDGLTLYKQSKDSALYMDSPPDLPLGRRRWYWPFYRYK